MKKNLIIFLFLFLVACANTKLQAIKGKDTQAIVMERGTPISKVIEDKQEMWTYRHENCTELVFFGTNGKVMDLHELGECPLPE